MIYLIYLSFKDPHFHSGKRRKMEGRIEDLWVDINSNTTRLSLSEIERALSMKIFYIDDIRKALTRWEESPYFNAKYLNIQIHLPSLDNEKLLGEYLYYDGSLKSGVSLDELREIQYSFKIRNRSFISYPGQFEETALKVLLKKGFFFFFFFKIFFFFFFFF